MPASVTRASEARLLFVVDNDYGNLTLAMLFLYGQQLAARSTILLPPRLFESNSRTLPVRTRLYESYADVVRAIAEENPDVVLLVEGYLFPLHGLMTAAELGMLVELLRSRGITVVTFDPFWGLMMTPHRTLARHHFATSGSSNLFTLLSYIGRLLSPIARKLAAPARALKGVVHAYPAPAELRDVQSVWFFNPNLISGSQPLPPAEAVSFPIERLQDPKKPYWVFVLAREDYERQQELIEAEKSVGSGVRGRDVFADRAVATLRQAAAADRYPVFIAPADCIADVEKRLTAADDVALVRFLPYTTFLPVLWNAECAFYWNAISTSSFVRIVNSLPVFYFDRGHIARGLDPVYRRVLESFYQGWEPVYIDQGRELTIDALKPLAEDYRRATIRIRERLMKGPTPAQMIDLLLAQPAGA